MPVATGARAKALTARAAICFLNENTIRIILIHAIIHPLRGNCINFYEAIASIFGLNYGKALPHLARYLTSDTAYHGIAFAALILPRTLHDLKNMIWLTPAALIFGAAIERVQPLVDRSAEMADFVADIVCVACGLKA